MTTAYAGTREFAQMCLEKGHKLHYSVWTFWSTGWTCDGGCCNDDGIDVEEVMSTLDSFCEGRYEEVRVAPKT